MINFNYAKKFVGEKALQQTLNYLAKSPEQNIPKLASLLKQIAINREHKEKIEVLLQSYNQNSNTRKYINRILTENNPYVRQKMVINYVINNSLMGVPRRKQKINMILYHLSF